MYLMTKPLFNHDKHITKFTKNLRVWIFFRTFAA